MSHDPRGRQLLDSRGLIAKRVWDRGRREKQKRHAVQELPRHKAGAVGWLDFTASYYLGGGVSQIHSLNIYYMVPLRNVGNVKSRGRRKVNVTGNTRIAVLGGNASHGLMNCSKERVVVLCRN